MIPKKLYHATYRDFIDNIKSKGLGNIRRKINSYSKPGVVSLSETPEDALASIEWTEWVENSVDADEYYDSQLVLEVDTNWLDTDKLLYINETDGFEYQGVIPWEACQIVSQDESANYLNEDLGDYEMKNVNGHLGAYKNGKFICSGDSKTDLENSLKELEMQHDDIDLYESSFAADFKLFENLWD
jgi:hypothetical protein